MQGIFFIYKNNPVAFYSALFFFLAGIFFTFLYINSPPGDFANYYYGSKFLLNPELKKDIYECWKFNADIETIFSDKTVYSNYTPVPPFSLLFYLPFVLLKLKTAKLIFNILSISVFCISWFRLLKMEDLKTSWLFAAVVFFIFPLKSNIEQGQTYLLIAALLIEFYLARKNRKFILAALIIALTVSLKIFPAWILVLLLFNKEWKLVLYSLGGVLLLNIILIPITGNEILYEYFFRILPRLGEGQIINPWSVNYQNMDSFLKNIFVHDQLLNPDGYNLWYGYKILLLLFSLSILAAVFKISATTVNTTEKFCFIIFSSLLLSGYGTTYSLLLFIFVFILILKMDLTKGKRLVLLSLLFLISNIPFHLLYDKNIFLAFLRFFLVILTFILIFFWEKKKSKINLSQYLFLFCFVVFALFSFPQSKIEGTYFLNKEECLLTYDFYSDGKNLHLIGKIGPNKQFEKTIAAGDSLYNDPDLKLKDGQLFYKQKQITFLADRKMKPLRLGETKIIYLSDLNRGVGFYTLRIISLN